MEVEVLEVFENPLLSRREVRFAVKHPGAATPRRFEVRKALSGVFNVELDRVYVLSLVTKTGMNVSEGVCHIYDNVEVANQLVLRHIYVKNLPPEERAKLKGGE